MTHLEASQYQTLVQRNVTGRTTVTVRRNSHWDKWGPAMLVVSTWEGPVTNLLTVDQAESFITDCILAQPGGPR